MSHTRRTRKQREYGIEAKLALVVMDYLKTKHGATCYPELEGVDIVARMPDGEVWVVECKKEPNLYVFEQAWRSRDSADRILVAFPNRLQGNFVESMAVATGVGLILIGDIWSTWQCVAWESWKEGDPIPPTAVKLVPAGKLERKVRRWDTMMVPEAETFSMAGGSGVKSWTVTRMWELEVKAWVGANPGKTCVDILMALRPPRLHKITKKPLSITQQDRMWLFHLILSVFTDFYVEGTQDSRHGLVWLVKDWSAKQNRDWEKYRADRFTETRPVPGEGDRDGRQLRVPADPGSHGDPLDPGHRSERGGLFVDGPDAVSDGEDRSRGTASSDVPQPDQES